MNILNPPPFIPENAPFSKDQIGWLNGYLAGMYSAQGGGEATPAVEATPVTILWGSQTGNTESLAKQVAKSLKSKGFEPKVLDMGDYDNESLKDEGLLLLMTSTYGEGDPPDNAASLYEWILSDAAPKLENLKYSVLSLGDSNYPDFCKCGIDFDERFKALGATQIAPRVDCDADFDEAFEGWISSLGGALGAGASSSDRSSYERGDSSEPEFGKKNPFPAKVLDNRNLNGDDSSKQTQHVALSIAGSGFSYEAGDALAVVPENCAEYVNDFVAAAGFDGSEEVVRPNGERGSLSESLISDYDITNLSPKILKALAELSGNEKLNALINNKDALNEFSWGRQLIDVLVEFKHDFESADQLVSIMNKVAPRLYSISSSPKAHEDEVHVTVGLVSYESHGRNRKGVCSSYLAEQVLETPVKVYFHASKNFKLPEDNDAPVIMVGPGTGIAPFRSFLEERAARKAGGDNWLFFGDQHASCDFLYSDEIDAYQKNGLLTRFETAFSRDQEEKIYVQDRMIEHGVELYAWLERGGYFYVCGDASRMAKDVDAALHTVVEVHGGMTSEQAGDYIKKLKSEKRYLRDVY